MAENIVPGEIVSPTPIRHPLLSKVLSPTTPPPKQIRRKTSFVRRIDSSEDLPSAHSSIYEAPYFSSEDSLYKIESKAVVSSKDLETPSPSKAPELNESNQGTEIPSIGAVLEDKPFKYGRGTVLETITEQKSYTTMHSLVHAKSFDEMYTPFLAHRDSFVLMKGIRRRRSFSLDDLAFIKNSYHEACLMIAQEERKSMPAPEIYAEPKSPIHAPLYRRPTPPGIPSWTAAQNAPRRRQIIINQPGKPNRLQRFLGLPDSGMHFSSRITNPVLISRPVRSRRATTFRPPRSMYGVLEQHPFYNTSMAKMETFSVPLTTTPTTSTTTTQQPNSHLPVTTGKRRKGLRVRFNSSAVARDIEMDNLQNAMGASNMSSSRPREATLIPLSHSPSGRPQKCPHRKSKSQIQDTMPPSNAYSNLSTHTPTSQHSPVHQTSTFSLPPLRFPPFLNPNPNETVDNSSPISSLGTAHSQNLGILNINPLRQATQIHASPPSSLSPTHETEREDRNPSFSSTTHLMGGGLTPGSSAPSSPSNRSSPLHAGQRNGRLSERFGDEQRGGGGDERDDPCWKCRVMDMKSKIGSWFIGVADCFCFVCCGVGADEWAGQNNNRRFSDNSGYGDNMRYEESLTASRAARDWRRELRSGGLAVSV
ncbi:hypothetical protein B7494_g7225 [Chlorociboria aeruginascens]|nr:hypothetical protein B7494_g7225 [Chlorociboria aeruginascens]